MTAAQMTRTQRSTLEAVRDALVVCHPAGSHHCPGWGWASGGDVTLPVQGVLSALLSAGLISVDCSGMWHVDGDPVRVTRAGSDRLAAWTAGVTS